MGLRSVVKINRAERFKSGLYSIQLRAAGVHQHNSLARSMRARHVFIIYGLARGYLACNLIQHLVAALQAEQHRYVFRRVAKLLKLAYDLLVVLLARVSS